MHLDEERLQRLIHGELPSAEEKIAREHASSCGDCSRRLEEIEREERAVDSLLRELDDPAPRLDAGAIARRAEARRPRLLRWAAGVALVLGVGGVAYALPGSPLPRWIGAIVEWTGGAGAPLSPTVTSPEPADRSPAGIAVAPGEDLLILFRTGNARGRVLVTLTERADVEIHAPHGAATFTVGETRLVVNDEGLATTYEIGIPATAPRIEIRVGERRIFLKEGSRITSIGSSGGSPPYLLPLAGSGP